MQTNQKEETRMSGMSHRERFFKAVNHQKPDRVPVDYAVRPDVGKNLINYLGLKNAEELYQKLGIDFRKLFLKENHPEFNERVKENHKKMNITNGANVIYHEDGSKEDAWGVITRTSEDGRYNEWVSGPFVDNMDLDSYKWPDMSIYESLEDFRKRVDVYEGKYVIHGVLNNPFKTCWNLRGMENYLCDMMIEPDFAKELMKRVTEYEIFKGLRLIEAGCDILGISGDIAMQDRLLVNPRAWREIDKPNFARMVQKFKEAKPDIVIYFHSDGNLEEVIPDLIEVGVEIINPMQPECMDLVKIKKLYGDKFIMHGTISIQRTLPFGTVDDVRNEVLHRIKYLGENGGLILAPSNHVQPDTPMENIIEIYRAAGSFVED